MMRQTTHSTIERMITPILDACHAQIKQGMYQLSIQELTLNLKKILDSVGSQRMNSEVRDLCVQHPISKLIFQDPCTWRSFSKPESYAGDAHLIDYIYRLSTIGSEVSFAGRQIFNVNISSSSTESVRWRAYHLSTMIEQISTKKNRKIKILSVASGRCRELAMVQDSSAAIERFVCLDQDKKSNEIVRRSNPGTNLHVLDESILFLLKGGLGDQKFDFIYSAGLFDYLEKKVAAKLIQSLYRNLDEGGTLLIPNFAPGLLEQGYMETFMDWKLIYRTEEQMLELAEIAGIERNSVHLYRDPMYNVIYMRIGRNV